MRKILYLLFLLLLCAGLVGCGAARETGSAPPEQAAFFSAQDDLGRTVTLEKQPERIVALSPSFLEPLGAVGASVVGRPSSKAAVPDFARDAEEVGNVNNINIEKAVALRPDLVIAYAGRHDKFVPILEANQIPVLVLQMKTYRDVQDKLQLLARAAGAPEKGAALAARMDEQVRGVLERLPQKSPRVAILFSTAKSVTVQLEGSIAGSVAALLGFENIAVGANSAAAGGDSAPYSLESLVAQDPEMIFVVTMGKKEEIQKRMTEDVESSPAWSALGAVQNKRVYFLPQELFLLNPGLRYPEAVRAMAAAAYPGVFDDGA